MEILTTNLSGLLIIKPDVYSDERGYFFEAYNKAAFEAAGIDADFVQDNESCSAKGVLRGMHMQKEPHSQGKLVRVTSGAVLDVAVDLRKDSPTYGQWSSIVLSGENKLMYWIPAGFAHGFLTLEDKTVFAYKCSGLYNKSAEVSIKWNDPDLNIEWGVENPILSEKDKRAGSFKEFSANSL
jgi:dTDP-4-dehydrorhamnose 3,5-epimerase